MDDLTTIKGIGKATAKKLADAGIGSFLALAQLHADDAALIAIEKDSGKRAGWIAAAIELANTNTEGTATGDPVPAAADDAAGPDDPERSDQGGAGDPAGPAQDAAASRGRAAWLALEELGEDEALRRHPLALAAIRAWAGAAGSAGRLSAGPVIRIAAQRGGFRRSGMAHPVAATDHAVERFTPDELERLLGEPMLVVELI